MHRIIADAQSGQTATLIGDHHDLRWDNIVLDDGGAAHQGRATAIKAALMAFREARAKGKLKSFPIGVDDYEVMLVAAFDLHDAETKSARAIGANAVRKARV